MLKKKPLSYGENGYSIKLFQASAFSPKWVVNNHDDANNNANNNAAAKSIHNYKVKKLFPNEENSFLLLI